MSLEENNFIPDLVLWSPEVEDIISPENGQSYTLKEMLIIPTFLARNLKLFKKKKKSRKIATIRIMRYQSSMIPEVF